MRVEADLRSIEPPNDPVFFLRHCFVDKVWTDWQECRRRTILIARPHYAPLRDGPGHNLDDQLKPRTRAVRDVLDISDGYEPHPSQPSI
jgi:tyrosinase